MGQCKSCSAQRLNNSSSVPQTPEFELNPNNNLFGAPTSFPTNQTTALKLKSKIKSSSSTSDSSSKHLPSSEHTQSRKKKPGGGGILKLEGSGVNLMHSVDTTKPLSIVTDYHQQQQQQHQQRKLSKKYRVSPQTSNNTPKSVSFWNKGNSNCSLDTNSNFEPEKPSSAAAQAKNNNNIKPNQKRGLSSSFRKLLSLQTKNTTSDFSTPPSKLDLTAFTENPNDGKQKLASDSKLLHDNNEGKQCTASNKSLLLLLNDQASTTTAATTNNNQGLNDKNQCKESNKIITAAVAAESDKFTWEISNNNTSTTTTNNLQQLQGLRTVDTSHIPITSLTLQHLNSSRQEKKVLRDLFFFGTANTNNNSTNIASTTITDTISSSTCLFSNIPTSDLYTSQLANMASKNKPNPSPLSSQKLPGPEKMRRTFQYQSPKTTVQSTSGSTNHYRYSPQGTNTNINVTPRIDFVPSTQIDQNVVNNNNIRSHGEKFSTNTPKFGGGQTNYTPSTEKTPETRRFSSTAYRTPNQNIGIGINTQLHASGGSSSSSLRKPEQNKPLYTILYPNRNPAIPISPSFNKINTGLVSQRKNFYQGKFNEDRSSRELPSSNTELRRTSWVVKDTISSSAKKAASDRQLQKSQSPAADNTTYKMHHTKESVKIRPENMKTNFPIQRETSTSSADTTASTDLRSSERTPLRELDGSGSGDHHHHHRHRHHGHHQHQNVSDSEYLDDEISDQPDLTLTFKEISSSSSGESLLSDQMLDRNVVDELRLPGRVDVEASDSAFSDVSSTNPPSLTHARSTDDGLSSPKNRRRIYPATQTLTPTYTKSKEFKPNFILRNIKHTTTTPKKIGVKSRVEDELTKPIIVDRHSTQTFTKSIADCPKASPSSTTTVKQNEKQPFRITRNEIKSSESSHHVESKESTETQQEPVVVKELIEDISYLKEQLQVLRNELEDREKIETEKDSIIEKLMQEIDILKRSSSSNSEGRSLSNGFAESAHVSFPRSNLRLDCQPTKANAAAQTDSDIISPVRGLSADDYEKFGEMVSFRIGRRISASTTPTTPDVSSLGQKKYSQ